MRIGEYLWLGLCVMLFALGLYLEFTQPVVQSWFLGGKKLSTMEVFVTVTSSNWCSTKNCWGTWGGLPGTNETITWTNGNFSEAVRLLTEPRKQKKTES